MHYICHYLEFNLGAICVDWQVEFIINPQNMTVCSDCGKVISVNAKSCQNCGCVFEISVSDSYKAMTIIFTILFPLIGFILSLVGIVKGDKVCYRITVILSIILFVIPLWLWVL